MNRPRRKLFVLLVLLGAIFLAWRFGVADLLTLEGLKRSKEAAHEFLRERNPVSGAVGFILAYAILTGLSVPGATLLTLAGGALFGFFPGVLLNLIGATTGAWIAFEISRWILRDWIRGRYEKEYERIDRGFREEGAYSLFALRLSPIFPYFLVNWLMGLTSMRASTFVAVSFVGMFPGAAVYTFAGTELSRIRSTRDLLSPGLIVALTLLGLLPLAAKRGLQFFRRSGSKR